MSRLDDLISELRADPRLLWDLISRCPLVVGPWVRDDILDEGVHERYRRWTPKLATKNYHVGMTTRYTRDVVKSSGDEHRIWSWVLWLPPNSNNPLHSGTDTLLEAQAAVDDQLLRYGALFLDSYPEDPPSPESPGSRLELLRD